MPTDVSAVVVDASVVVAALSDSGRVGSWADNLLAERSLVAPYLMPAEVANILRRLEGAGQMATETASLANGDLLDLRIDLLPYVPFAERAWQLRASVTCYDAWYVAAAETLGLPLATLDGRLARANGPRCEFMLPGAA